MKNKFLLLSTTFLLASLLLIGSTAHTIDTDWTMVIGSCNADGSNTQLYQADVRFEMSDTNTVQGTRAVTGSTPTCHVFVVEWSSSFVDAVYTNT